MNHARWKLGRERRVLAGIVEPPEIVAEREQIRLAMALGQLVYDRRTALGLTEKALADRLGEPEDEIERIELGGVVPVTSALLQRLARALDVAVDVHIEASGSAVTFESRAA